MTDPAYSYRVVTTNGHGIHSREFTRVADAKRAAEGCAARSPKLGPYEIERVQHFHGGSRRYWLRQRSRWVPWDYRLDIDTRRPDWRYD